MSPDPRLQAHSVRPAVYCPFCKTPVQDKVAHFESDYLRLSVAVASVFRSLLAELIVQWCTVEQETVHTTYVTKGSHGISFRVVMDGVPWTEPRFVWVTMFGLFSVTMPAVDDALPVALSPLALVYIRALRTANTTEDVGFVVGGWSGPWP